MVLAAPPDNLRSLPWHRTLRRPQIAAALLVCATFFVGAGGPLSIALVIGIAVLLLLIVLAARRPQIGVIGIVAWPPLQLAVLAFAYKSGVPGAVVRNLGLLKEFWAISLFVAAWQATRERKIKADLLDWLLALYVGSATLYLVLPFAAPAMFGGTAFGPRLNAWRADCLYVVVFLCVRRLSFDASVVRRLRVALFVVAIILGGFAFWEIADNAGFNSFLIDRLGYTAYLTDVLNSPPLIHNGILSVTQEVNNSSVIRAGSLFSNALQFGFFMVIPLGVALDRVASGRQSALGLAAAGASVAGIIFSNTRGAVLSAGVAIVLAVAFGVSRISSHRLRLILTVMLASAALLPLAAHSSLVARMESIVHPSHDQRDTEVHVTRSREGLKQLIEHPLGRGLGANHATGQRFNTSTSIVTEDSYLETGNELGVPALLLFMAGLGVLLIELRRRSNQLVGSAGLAGGAWLAGCGLAIGGFTLQTWYELIVALSYWAVAGLALSHIGPEARQLTSKSTALEESLATARGSG
jgi:hypothetical protein